MASACVEIETSRAIGTQILRHRSFSFQEFSQRYADTSQLGFEPIELRKQSEKNRQSSTEIFNPIIGEIYTHSSDNQLGVEKTEIAANDAVDLLLQHANETYQRLVKAGVAKEQARFILPAATTTRMYMAGTIRSWMHYLDLRCQPDTQKEHREVALSIRDLLKKELPTVADVMGWQEL